jgi:hypothetical protein
MNDNISALQNEKDYGNEKRREEIKNSMNQLLWERNHIKQQLQELKAATAINWVNIKSRFDEFIQKIKGKPLPQ